MECVAEIRDAVNARRASAGDAVRKALGAADRSAALNAFRDIFPEEAMAQAARIDARVAAGERLPLAGVPLALKDNICVCYGRTTCGSKMLENYRSPFTATAAQRLIDAGAIVIGKTNLDEFAMGSSGENSAFGPTKNPHDQSRVPGGSSSGSAAAVAAGVVPLALGSDTGGSIRQPAAFCGLVGVKPTYGRVSRYGLVAFASSLDQIGPLTASVEDAAIALGVLCGHDPLDSTSASHAVPDLSHQLDSPIDDLTLAVPRQARSEANHPDVARVFEETISVYRSLGAKIVDVDLPLTDAAIAAYYIVAPAEASSNLARFDGVRYGHRAELKPGESLMDLYCRSRAEGFGPEVRRRIMLGTHVLSSGYYDAYYTTALKARRKILDDYNRALRVGAHAILLPATPGPAFKIGEKTSDPLAMYLEDVYTVGVNLAGLPAMVVPAGFATVDEKKLPIGVQLIGAAFDEATMLRTGRMLERELDVSPRV
jgi:aspartyl-tRNA(Asn)/glutamyl-tRNA(Gln) amidotransferase subunit A